MTTTKKSRPTSTKFIPPDKMATTAMSDEMTIGFEQIAVSITLMIVSLCFLSRHQFKGLYHYFFGDSGSSKSDDKGNTKIDGQHKNSSSFGIRYGSKTTTTSNGIIRNENYSSRNNGSDHPMQILTKKESSHDSGNNNDAVFPNNFFRRRRRGNQTSLLNGSSSSSTSKKRVSSSPIRKCQSSPMVSSIPMSIVTTPNNFNPATTPTTITTPQSTYQTPQHHPHSHSSYSSSTKIQEINDSNNNNNNNIHLSNNHENENNGNEYDDEYYTTLTDHERFTKAYESHLRHAEYRRLILPATCRLLDTIETTKDEKMNNKNGKNKGKDNKKETKKKSKQKHTEDDDDDDIDQDDDHDHDDESMMNIFSWIIDVMHKIISFDYIGNTFILIVRICKAFMCRFRRVLAAWGYNIKVGDEEEEEDEDDLTVGSMSSKRSLLSKESSHGGITSAPVSPLKHYNPTALTTLENHRNSNATTGMNHQQQQHHSSLLSDTSVNSLGASFTSLAPVLSSSNNNSLILPKPGNPSTIDESTGKSTVATRERFYTGEGALNNSKNKSKTTTTTTIATTATNGISKDELDQSIIESNSSLEFTRTDSVSSLLAYSESWEHEQKQQQQHQSKSVPQNFDSLLMPSTNQLLGTDEEKKDTSTIGSSDYSQIESTTSMSEILHAQSLPDISVELSSSTLASENQNKGSVKKSKKPSTSSTSTMNSLGGHHNNLLNKPSMMPRPTSKRKDALEKHRNPASRSVVIQTQKSQTHDDKITPPLTKHQSTELSYYFDTATNRATIKKLERETPLPDREGYILGDQFLEDSKDTPLLVFVNSRSGSQQGLMLKMQLRSLMNPIQVWDLADGGPEKILRSFLVFSRLRLLVCGGDGTVSWIISALNKMKIEKWPPIAILPLGTGNDLARIHGWGGGYANESLLLILKQVQEAYISLLDRWTIKIERKKKRKKSEKKESHEIKPFTNYMSIGMDALSALQVHNLRENSPDMFFSRAINKLWYTLYGAEDAIKASCSDLPKQVVLIADGVEVPIPKDSRGLIILNIDSYLGGVPLWSRGVPIYRSEKNTQKRRERRYSDGDSIMHLDSITNMRRTGSFDSVLGEDIDSEEAKLEKLLTCDSPSSCQDGLLDVISIRGNFHLGQIRVGIANAHRLCQCTSLKIELKKSVAVQLDGEPWKQDKSILTLEREKDPAIMLHRAAEGGGGIETEVADLLEWAEENSIIERDVHATLMKEFSRRIESKTRARRDRNEANVFSSMKRGITSRNRLNQTSF